MSKQIYFLAIFIFLQISRSNSELVSLHENDKLLYETLEKPDECQMQVSQGIRLQFLYTGMLEDGTVFDSNQDQENPFEFELGDGSVIEGMDKGVVGMCLNEVRKLIIHPDLAYKDVGYGDIIPPNQTLHFTVRFIGFYSKNSNHLHDTFAQIDADDNGMLSQDEVSVFIQNQEGENKASEEEHNNLIADIFNNEDDDKDGEISRSEFFREEKHDEL